MPYRFSPPSPCVSLALLVLACALPMSASADAERHTLRLEGAGALMVGEQVDRFDIGGGFGLSYEYRLIDHLGIEGRYQSFFFPEAQEGAGFGGYQTFGAALRVHPLPSFELGDFWISGGGNSVFTGDLVRFGLEAGVGFEFYVNDSWRLGPYVRYAHVFQPTSHELGPADAGFIQIGVSLAFSPKRRTKPEEPVEEEEEPVEEAVDEKEPLEEEPAVEEEEEEELVEVTPDHVETTAERELREVAERILFPHGSDEPIVDSMSALVRVGQIIQEHPEWEKITIEGHASVTGSPEVNKRLSERRAQRMKELLVRGGIDARRIEVIGQGERNVEASGTSESAHAKNRRVVFKVHVIRRVPVRR